ncbi:hypothetical protein KIMH_03860 [Bombiscardovia apis]|uniref:Uncharacterized protein n=1 Tax=Bombiscardovia apis TaxID=2932182 RepID=A0ABM8BBM0_9BIFI|nr:hypothetical protein KIMH_03860 [Bombiscardovia apis]
MVSWQIHCLRADNQGLRGYEADFALIEAQSIAQTYGEWSERTHTPAFGLQDTRTLAFSIARETGKPHVLPRLTCQQLHLQGPGGSAAGITDLIIKMTALSRAQQRKWAGKSGLQFYRFP